MQLKFIVFILLLVCESKAQIIFKKGKLYGLKDQNSILLEAKYPQIKEVIKDVYMVSNENPSISHSWALYLYRKKTLSAFNYDYIYGFKKQYVLLSNYFNHSQILIDQNGSVIIPAKYENIYQPGKNLVVKDKDGLEKVIGEKDNTIIPSSTFIIPLDFDNASYYGVKAVSDSLYYFYNELGQKISPKGYKDVGRIVNDNSKAGFFYGLKNYKSTIYDIYSFGNNIYSGELKDFFFQNAKVVFLKKDSAIEVLDSLGKINKIGRGDILQIEEGMMVCADSGRLEVYNNKFKKTISSNKYKEIKLYKSFPTILMAGINSKAETWRYDYGLLGINGETVLPFNYAECKAIKMGAFSFLQLLSSDYLTTIVDSTGKIIVSTKNYMVEEIKGGLARTRIEKSGKDMMTLSKNRFGLIDRKGIEVLPVCFDSIEWDEDLEKYKIALDEKVWQYNIEELKKMKEKFKGMCKPEIGLVEEKG